MCAGSVFGYAKEDASSSLATVFGMFILADSSSRVLMFLILVRLEAIIYSSIFIYPLKGL